MRAVILAGGLGTRLRPLTFSIPKPLLPVGEHPILELILKRLIEFGFEEFIFSVGYRAEFIEAYFGDGTRFGTRIHYLREEEPTGTAGALSLLQENFDISDDETFLLMNGDILTDLDFNRFIDHHKREGFDLTVGVKEIERQLPFGVLEMEDGLVRRIVEKPVSRYPISGGVYLVQGDVLPLVPTDTYFTIPDLVERLVAEGRQVGSYIIEEFWIGVEHQEELDEARHRIGVEPEEKHHRRGDPPCACRGGGTGAGGDRSGWKFHRRNAGDLGGPFGSARPGHL
jgi:NDP-sugar pyrophosphorylase family protein